MGQHFGIKPKLYRWVPVHKHYLTGASNKLVNDYIIQIIGFIDEKNVSARTVRFAIGIHADKLHYRAGFKRIGMLGAVPSTIIPIALRLHYIDKVPDCPTL